MSVLLSAGPLSGVYQTSVDQAISFTADTVVSSGLVSTNPPTVSGLTLPVTVISGGYWVELLSGPSGLSIAIPAHPGFNGPDAGGDIPPGGGTGGNLHWMVEVWIDWGEVAALFDLVETYPSPSAILHVHGNYLFGAVQPS